MTLFAILKNLLATYKFVFIQSVTSLVRCRLAQSAPVTSITNVLFIAICLNFNFITDLSARFVRFDKLNRIERLGPSSKRLNVFNQLLVIF